MNEPTVGIDVNGDGDKLDLNVGYSGSVYLFRKNPAGMDLIERRVDILKYKKNENNISNLLFNGTKF